MGFGLQPPGDTSVVTTRRLLWLAMITAVVPLLSPLPAHAQAMRTYISGAGKDSNACSLSAPCQTLQAALNKTLPGGEVQSLNSADYGNATIRQSVTIIGTQGVTGMLGANVSGIV